MQIQQLNEALDRSLKKRIGQTGEITFPVESEGKALKWDSVGNLVNSENDPDKVVSEAEKYAEQAAISASIAQAASGSIPTMEGNAGKYLKVNESEDGWHYEYIEIYDSLKPQCINIGASGGILGAGTGLQPQLLGAATNIKGNTQNGIDLTVFTISQDINLPAAPPNRRSTVILKILQLLTLQVLLM